MTTAKSVILASFLRRGRERRRDGHLYLTSDLSRNGWWWFDLYLTTTFYPPDQRRLRPVLPATRQDPKTHSARPQHKPRLLHQRHHLLQRRGRRPGRRLRRHHGDGLTSCSSSFRPPTKLEHTVLFFFFFCLRCVAPQLLPSPPNAASCWWKCSSIAREFLKLSLECGFNKLHLKLWI